MILRIKKRTNPYVQIDKRPLEECRISWRAKGILAYLLSKPDGWQVRSEDILSHGTEGRDAVRAAMQELRQYGYAELHQTPNGREWTIVELPCPENPVMEPCPEKANIGKSPLSKNKNKESNNESSSFGTKMEDFPEQLQTKEFTAAWLEWEKHRKEIKKTLTPLSVQKQLKQLLAMGPARAIAAINHSISNGYRGIFEPKKHETHKGTNFGFAKSTPAQFQQNAQGTARAIADKRRAELLGRS